MQLASTTTAPLTMYKKIFDHCLYTSFAKDDYAIHRSMWTSDSMHHILYTIHITVTE